MDERSAQRTDAFLWRRLTAAKLAAQLLKRDTQLSPRQRSLVETVSTAVDDVTRALIVGPGAGASKAPLAPNEPRRELPDHEAGRVAPGNGSRAEGHRPRLLLARFRHP